MHGIGFKPDDVELTELRERLQKMNDTELLTFGKDAQYMCSPFANIGKPPRECFVIQLDASHLSLRPGASARVGVPGGACCNGSDRNAAHWTLTAAPVTPVLALGSAELQLKAILAAKKFI
jgi:hypothetical protein